MLTFSEVIDHLSIAVRDLQRSGRFYDAALAPLGLMRAFEDTRLVGYGPSVSGVGRWPVNSELVRFWLSQARNEEESAGGGHVAFVAPSGAAVDSFFAAACAAGGHDDGPPGIRASYHPGYYAAYVRDPDGHRIEAVCHYGAGTSARWRTVLQVRSSAELLSFVRAKLRARR